MIARSIGLFVLSIIVSVRALIAADVQSYIDQYPNASAITLSHEVKIKYFFNKEGELQAKSEHELEIMALKDGADELELIQVPFDSFEKLTLEGARYYSTDDEGKLVLQENVKVRFAEEKDYYIENIFYSDLKVKQFAPSIKIKEGMVLRYNYTVVYKDLKFLNRFSPQMRNDYLEEFELKLSYPKNVEIDVNLFNFREGQVSDNISESKEFKSVSYKVGNLSPIRRFEYTPPDAYIRPHFIVVTKGWQEKKKYHAVLNSTDDLYAWYEGLIAQLSGSNPDLAQLSASICARSTSEDDKIESIYSWVQDYINYVAFEDGIAGFKPEEAQDVANQKYGDCKGISNLLVTLLKEAGFDAHHAWIGTRHLPYDYSLPSIVVDNHMICALNYKGAWMFLDGTDNTADWRKPSAHIQGKSVLIGLGDEYVVKTIPIAETKESIVDFKLDISLSEKSFSEVSGKIVLKGYERNNMRSWVKHMEYSRLNEIPVLFSENYLDFFICRQPDKIDERSIANSLRIDGLITGNYLKRGNRLLLFCDISDDIKLNPNDTVTMPKYFSNKGIKNFEFRYKLPAGASIETVPESIDFLSANGNFACRMAYKLENNELVYTKTIEVNTLLLDEKDLSEWNDFVYVQHKIKAIYVEVVL